MFWIEWPRWLDEEGVFQDVPQMPNIWWWNDEWKVGNYNYKLVIFKRLTRV